jgi:2-dehydro-3-deoxyphosphooctonate aldolase (KDO 8-P synthase)
MESTDLYFETGEHLRLLMTDRDWYYKASFDKANRSTVTGWRGPGLESGLRMFRDFKQTFPGIKLLTDIHECYQAELLAPYIDCIQIPAFLCRQTDLLLECASHFDKINIKKGQWVSPENIAQASDKVRSKNPEAEVWLCERGTQFGYDRVVVDFRTVDLFKRVFDKVVLDCTHSTQSTAADGKTTGNRGLAEKYLLASSLFGYTGVFAEVHPRPAEALSDADCQIELARLPNLLGRFDAIVASDGARPENTGERSKS